jgi:protein-tyrosine phosphatase
VIGHPIHQEAALVLEQLGGEPSDFTARQLTPKIASAADLVLTMTKTHRDNVLELAPHRLHRTFTLSEAARLVVEHNAQCVADLAELRHLVAHEATDVPDPMGQSAEVHALAGAQIAELLAPVLELCRRE